MLNRYKIAEYKNGLNSGVIFHPEIAGVTSDGRNPAPLDR